MRVALAPSRTRTVRVELPSPSQIYGWNESRKDSRAAADARPAESRSPSDPRRGERLRSCSIRLERAVFRDSRRRRASHPRIPLDRPLRAPPTASEARVGARMLAPLRRAPPRAELRPRRCHVGAGPLGEHDAHHRDLASVRARTHVGRRRRSAEARDGAPVRRRGARDARRDARTGRRSATCASASASTPRRPAFPKRRRAPRRGASARAHRAKLLALASSPNVHEAEAAMRHAQRLMLKHNVARSGATAARLRVEAPRRPTGRRRGARARCSRRSSHEFFFVEAISVPVYRPLEGKRGSDPRGHAAPRRTSRWPSTCTTSCFTPPSASGAQHKRAQRHPRRSRSPHLPRRRDARLLGEARVGEGDDERAPGLVWVGDRDLDAYFRTRHPRVHHVRSQGRARNASYAEGKKAGKSIVLHRPLSTGPSGGRPKLLTRG